MARLALSLSAKYGKCTFLHHLSEERTTENPQRPLSEMLLNNIIELAPTKILEVQPRFSFPLTKPSFEKR